MPAEAAEALRVTNPGAWQRIWPLALGLLIAAVTFVDDLDRDAVASTVALAALCYLAAAATGLTWTAWAVIPIAVVWVRVSDAVGVPWWIGLAALCLVALTVGLLRSADDPRLWRQVAAAIAVGVLAGVALRTAPTVGLAVAGLTLAAHALWDVLHLRRREVVSPALAWFCIALDIPLGLGAVALALS